LLQRRRKRKGKKHSNEDWTSPTDLDAKITQGEGRLDAFLFQA